MAKRRMCITGCGKEITDMPDEVRFCAECFSFDSAGAAKDVIDNPEHYGGSDNPYETIKVMIQWYGPAATAAFCRGSATKYLSRAGEKVLPGETPEQAKVRDLRKAAWYATAEANLIEHGKIRV